MKIRQDLFGFLDLVAIRADRQGVLGIQATSRSNAAARVAKIIEQPAAKVWLASGNRIEVWSWRKKGTRWDCKREAITSGQFESLAIRSTA